MAYRVNTTLTLGQTIQRLRDEHGCKLVDVKLHGPRGQTVARRLVRVDENGKKWVATLPLVPDTAALIPTGVRTICAQLGLAPDVLGVLGDSTDPSDPIYEN